MLRHEPIHLLPSTRTRDLALGPSLFLWDSRSTTTAVSPLGSGSSLQAYWNVAKPDAARDWTLGAQFQFLFPR